MDEARNIAGQPFGIAVTGVAANGGVGVVHLRFDIRNPVERYSIEFNGVTAAERTYHRRPAFEEGNVNIDSGSFLSDSGFQAGLVWGENTVVVRNSADGSASAPKNFFIGAPRVTLDGITLNPTMPVVGQDLEVSMAGDNINNFATVRVLRSGGNLEEDDEEDDDPYAVFTEGTAVATTNLQITRNRITFQIPASEPLPPGLYVVEVAYPPSDLQVIQPATNHRVKQEEFHRIYRRVIGSLNETEASKDGGFVLRTFKVPFLKPAITELAPMEVEVGTGNVAFTIQGAGFYGGKGFQDGTEVFLVDPDAEAAGRLTTIMPRFQVIDFSTIEVTVSASLLADRQRLDVFVLNPAKTLEEGSSNIERLVLKPPTPKIVSLSDLVASAGSGAKTLEIFGEDFADAIVLWGSTVLTPTTEIDDRLEVSIPASLLAAAATTTITVENQHPSGNQTSNAASFKVTNSTGVSLNPISLVLAGTVTGFLVSSPQRFFVPPFGAGQSNVVKLNGSSLTTTYDGSGRLMATFAGNQPPAAGIYEVSVVDHLGVTLGPTTLTVKNPKPVFNGGSFISHGTAFAGRDFTLRIDGTGYLPGMVLQLNGEKLSPTIINGTRLEVVIPADLIPIPIGSSDPGLRVDFTVFNARPNDGVTPGFFLVKNPVPVLDTVEPSEIEPAAITFTQNFNSDPFAGVELPQFASVEGTVSFRVTGTGFVPGVSQVGRVFNDPDLTTAYVSTTELHVTMPASLLADSQLDHRAIGLRVYNTGPGGGETSVGTLRVRNPAPQIQTLSRAFVNQGTTSSESPDEPSVEITISGTNFTPRSQVQLSGPSATHNIRMVSITEREIRFRLLKLNQLTPGTLSIQVVNPETFTGQGLLESNALNFNVLRARPTIDRVRQFLVPGQAPRIEVSGSGIDENTVVEWNGEPMTVERRYLSPPVATRAGGIFAAPGTVTLRLHNEDGQFSDRFAWSTPIINSVSPEKFEVGFGPVTFTVLGENFANGAVVGFGQLGDIGTTFETTFVSSTELRAVMPLEFLTINQIPANSSSNRFWGPIKVTNPDGNEGVGQFLTITRPTAAVTRVTPASVVAGSGQFTLAIEGRNFSPGNTFVLFGGRELVTTAISNTSLTAVVPANFITTADTLELIVGSTNNDGILNGSASFTILPAPDSRRLSIAATATNKPEGNDPNFVPFALLHTFTITRSGATTAAASVNYSVTGSGANPATADDFLTNALPSGTISFAPNQTSQVITIAPHSDTTIEPSETFDVTLSNVIGGSIFTATAVGTFINDDASFAIAAANASKAEGNTATSPFTFTVTRSGATTGAGSVKFAVTGSGANPAVAADFGSALPTGTVNFAAGETSKTVTINVKGDAVFEPDEGFTVTLSSPVGGALGESAAATGTILNDDSGFSIAATDPNKAEGNSATTPFTFTVTRNGATITPASVKFAVTAPSGGANAADFGVAALPSGTLNFAPSETSKTITLNVIGDTAIENNENFVVTLSAPVGASLGTAIANGTIQTDDTALAIAVAPNGSNKIEGHTGSTAHTFIVTRTGLTTGATSVDVQVAGVGPNPANEADFGGEFLGDTLEFAANETSKLITINVDGDTAIESTETFSITLSNPIGASSLLAPTAMGTIISDDSSFSIAPLAAIKAEGNSGTVPFTFTVTRNGSTLGAASVNFAVTGSGDSPADVTDFGAVLPTGLAKFAAGAATAIVTINVKGDTTFEPDNGFTVTLSNPVGGVLDTATANGTILSDDATLTIAANDANKLEGTGGVPTPFTFTVTRTGGINVPASVKFTTATNGTGATASAAADFAGNAFPIGTVLFVAGETTKVIPINVNADNLVEGNEGFKVTLSAPTGGASLGAAATITANRTIDNDDASLTIAATSAVNVEGTGATPTAFTFTVTRMGDLSGTSSATFAVSGTASNGTNAADFGGAFPSGTVEFIATEGTKLITINVTGDTIGEAHEGFIITLSNPTNAVLGKTSASGTINNDDTSYSIAAQNATSAHKKEGNSSNTAFTFVVTRIGVAVVGSVQFTVIGSGDHSTDATDFASGVLPAGTLNFTAGQTSQTVTISVKSDKVLEANETFTITLLNPSLGISVITSNAAGMIINDD